MPRAVVLSLSLVGGLALACHDAPVERSAATRTATPAPSPAPAPSAAPAPAPVAANPPRIAAATTRAAPEPDGPRVYAKSRFVWIRPEPTAAKDWIGFLWSGGSVRLKSTTPIAGPGCATFYAIEPQGYVCADGKRATLDANDPAYVALARFALKAGSPYPHRYGESLGLPRYLSTPTPELQRQREAELTTHLANIAAAREGNAPAHLADVDFRLPEQGPIELPELPGTVFENRKMLKRRSTVAYSDEARFGDRGFLLTADYAWVPKDRVVPYPEVAFRGVALDERTKLPLAFFRKKERPKYTRAADGSFAASSATFERLSHVSLTGVEHVLDGERYLETREAGVWVRERDAVVPKPRAKTPWGAPVGGEDLTGRAPKGRGTWLEIAIDRGWMLAFVGTRAVYATLMSPGRGGAAEPDEDPLERSATPMGVYPISGKLVTATMEAPGELVHSDVPYAQNIVGPYALHGAYWHDNWGNPQSGGCVNLSPVDAAWLFEFTEPAVPPGWHAVRWLPWQGAATIVILHR